MSIVQIDSNFTLTNKTDHFLTLQISSKENSSFRLSSNSENVHPVNFSDVYLQHNSIFNYYIETAWSALNGQRLYAVAVNLEAGSTVKASISCTANLTFSFEIVSPDVTETLPGDFVLESFNQGGNVSVAFHDEMSVSNEVTVTAVLRNGQNEKISNVDVYPMTATLAN